MSTRLLAAVAACVLAAACTPASAQPTDQQPAPVQRYRDVPTSDADYAVIEWITAAGVLGECASGGSGTLPAFCPNDTVTRVELAKAIHAYGRHAHELPEHDHDEAPEHDHAEAPEHDHPADSPGRCHDRGHVVTWYSIDVDTPPAGYKSATWAIVRGVTYDRYQCQGWPTELWIHGNEAVTTYCEDTPEHWARWLTDNPRYDAICRSARDHDGDREKPYVHPADSDGQREAWFRYHTAIPKPQPGSTAIPSGLSPPGGIVGTSTVQRSPQSQR